MQAFDSSCITESSRNDERKNSLSDYQINSHFLKSSFLSDQSTQNAATRSIAIGVMFWITCCVANAMNLPFYKLIKSNSMVIRSMWRLFAFDIVILPFALWDIKKNSHRLNYLFTLNSFMTTGIIGFLGFMWTVLPYIASKYTYSSHCALFSGMPNVPLIMLKVLRGLPITRLEIYGAIGSFIGSFILCSGKSTSDLSSSSIITGDLIAFSSSIIGAAFIRFATPFIMNFPLNLYMLMQNTAAFLSCFLLLAINLEPVSFFSTDCMTGFFGMFCSQNIYILILGFGIFTGVLSGFSYYQCFVYFSPVIASMTSLISPIVTQIAVLLLGIEGFPGMQTVYGGLVIIISLYLVAKGEGQSNVAFTEKIQEQKKKLKETKM